MIFCMIENNFFLLLKSFQIAQDYAKHDISVLYSYSQIVIENISRDAIENSLIFSNPKLPTT